MRYLLPILLLIFTAPLSYADEFPDSITRWKEQASFFRSLDYRDEVIFKEKMKSFYAKVYGGEKYLSWASWIDDGNLESEYYSAFYDDLEDATVKSIIRTGKNSFAVRTVQDSCYSLNYNPPVMRSIIKDYKVTNMKQDEVDAWLNAPGQPADDVCLNIKRSISLLVDEISKLIVDEEWSVESSTLELHSNE